MVLCAVISYLVIVSILSSLLRVDGYANAIQDDIDSSDAEQFLERKNTTKWYFVNFYSPWCSHCKSLTREFAALTTELLSANLNVVLSSIDVTLEPNKKLVELLGIEGFPTINLYKYGVKTGSYIGSRTAVDMKSFLKRKMNLNPIQIASVSDVEYHLLRLQLPPSIESLKNADSKKNPEDLSLEEKYDSEVLGLVIGLFTTAKKKSDVGMFGKAANNFYQVSQIFDSAVFAYSDHTSLIEYFNIKQDCLIIYPSDKNLVASVIPLGKELNALAISNMITKHLFPTVITYSKLMQPFIRSLPIKLQALVFYDQSDKLQSTEFIFTIEQVSKNFRGSFVFIKVPVQEYHVSQQFGVSKANSPQIIVANMTDPYNLRKYAFNDYLVATTPLGDSDSSDSTETAVYRSGDLNDSHDIYQFLHDCYEGFLEPSLNSGDEFDSSSSRSDKVVTIVSRNFNAKVINDKMINAFVYFYAPWCAHCKAIEPVIIELAGLYETDENVNIFRIDATKNEVDVANLRIRGYPSFFLFTANNKLNPMEYTGKRTLTFFQNFIESFREAAVVNESGSVENGDDSNSEVNYADSSQSADVVGNETGTETIEQDSELGGNLSDDTINVAMNYDGESDSNGQIQLDVSLE